MADAQFTGNPLDEPTSVLDIPENWSLARGVAGVGRQLADIFQMPGEVAAGRVDPLSPEAKDWAAGMAMSMVGTPALTGGVPPGALGSGAARAMFDYSRLHEVPNVPQTAIERVQPARGVPKKYLDAEERLKAARPLVERGIKEGGLKWYNTEQLRNSWLAELGSKQGPADYNLFTQLVGATSPEMKVPNNIKAASYYYWLFKNDKPLPQRVLTEKGNWSVPPGQIPEGYGARTQALHVQNVENIRAAGQMPVLQNPKPPSFIANLSGNYRPVTIDRHNMRLLGFTEDTPGVGYGHLEQLQQREAARMGIAPAQYQASGWIGGAEQTGQLSGSSPFLKMFEDRLEVTAESMGVSKEQVFRDFIRGSYYLR